MLLGLLTATALVACTTLGVLLAIKIWWAEASRDLGIIAARLRAEHEIDAVTRSAMQAMRDTARDRRGPI